MTYNVNTTSMMGTDFPGNSWEKKERLHQGPFLRQPWRCTMLSFWMLKSQYG